VFLKVKSRVNRLSNAVAKDSWHFRGIYLNGPGICPEFSMQDPGGQPNPARQRLLVALGPL